MYVLNIFCEFQTCCSHIQSTCRYYLHVWSICHIFQILTMCFNYWLYLSSDYCTFQVLSAPDKYLLHLKVLAASAKYSLHLSRSQCTCQYSVHLSLLSAPVMYSLHLLSTRSTCQVVVHLSSTCAPVMYLVHLCTSIKF